MSPIVWACPACDAAYQGDRHPLATGKWICDTCMTTIAGNPIQQVNPTDAYVYAQSVPWLAPAGNTASHRPHPSATLPHVTGDSAPKYR